MINKLLCKLGLHRWIDVFSRQRYCDSCGRRQQLEFYSNRSQKWVDM